LKKPPLKSALSLHGRFQWLPIFYVFKKFGCYLSKNISVFLSRREG
jgi:hypothetical protein